MGQTVETSHRDFLRRSKSREIKPHERSESVPNHGVRTQGLRLTSRLPAVITNSSGDRPWKWRIYTFEGLVTLTLTLTLDRVTWHTVVQHSSKSAYTPNFKLHLNWKKWFVHHHHHHIRLFDVVKRNHTHSSSPVNTRVPSYSKTFSSV